MYDSDHTGMELIEPFFLAAAILWVLGALFFTSMAAMGSDAF